MPDQNSLKVYWGRIPAMFEYAAQDEDGDVYVYIIEPVKSDIMWISLGDDYSAEYLPPEFVQCPADVWTTSVISRPAEPIGHEMLKIDKNIAIPAGIRRGKVWSSLYDELEKITPKLKPGDSVFIPCSIRDIYYLIGAPVFLESGVLSCAVSHFFTRNKYYKITSKPSIEDGNLGIRIWRK